MNNINILLFTMVCIYLGGCSIFPEMTYPSKTRDHIGSSSIELSIQKECFFNVINKKVTQKQKRDCQQQVFYPINEKKSQIIAVLEINEQGHLINKEHVTAILNEVKNSKEPIVSVFVHGWKHNGQIDDDNLIQFKNMIISLNNTKNADSKRTNIGIYIAWRGATTKAPILEELTFWNRKNISQNIGRGDLGTVILDLERILKIKKTSLPEPERTNLVLAGHSFGASALYNALGPILLSRFEDSISEQIHHPNEVKPLKGVGDLILLINPAIEAKAFLPLREAVWRKASQEKVISPKIFKYNLHPFFVVLGSNADAAVNTAFPTGRWFGTLTQKYSKTAIIDGNGILSNKTKLHPSMDKYCNSKYSNLEKLNYCEVNENKLDRHAVGNFAPFYTHWLTLVKDDNKANLIPEVKSIGTIYEQKDVHLEKLNPLSNHPSAEQPICGVNNDWLSHLSGNNWIRKVNIFSTKNKDSLLISSTFIDDKWKNYGLNRRSEPNTTTLSESTSWLKNPYWFVRVNGKVIPDHTTIWDKEVGCFILSILDL
jgi:hypothetical protein